LHIVNYTVNSLKFKLKSGLSPLFSQV